MGFSKLNFIVPLNSGDKFLKIRNSDGAVEHIIRESTATTKTSTKYLYLKQSGESNLITLEFSDTAEALAANTLLRAALEQLGTNLGVSNTGNTGSGWTNTSTATESDCNCHDCPPKRHPVFLTDIWSQSNLIPNTAPGSSSGVVEIKTSIQLANIAGSKKFSGPLFTDIIPTYFGDGTSYTVVLKTYNGFTIPSNLYSIDYDCGIISFPNFINAGNILVDVTHPPKVDYFKYVGSKGLSVTPHLSLDTKFENPNATTVDGQNTGISELLEQPEGAIHVTVNCQPISIGDGCTALTFYNPDFYALFAKKYTVASSTSSSVTLSSVTDLSSGDYVILVDNTNVITCLQINSITGTTLNFLISTANTYTQAYKARELSQITIGDELLWFGSYAGYELDVTDTIVYNYLSK